MKKQLLTITAVAAAGVLTVSGAALAQKPSLTLGGSTEQIFGVGNDDDAFTAVSGKRAGFDQQSDGEIFFNGAVTLDNGIKIRTRVELESNTESNTAGETANVAHTSQGDTIDEHWMRISGSFGEIRLGSGDAAAQAMTTGYLGTWATGVGQNLAFDTGRRTASTSPTSRLVSPASSSVRPTSRQRMKTSTTSAPRRLRFRARAIPKVTRSARTSTANSAVSAWVSRSVTTR